MSQPIYDHTLQDDGASVFHGPRVRGRLDLGKPRGIKILASKVVEPLETQWNQGVLTLAVFDAEADQDLHHHAAGLELFVVLEGSLRVAWLDATGNARAEIVGRGGFCVVSASSCHQVQVIDGENSKAMVLTAKVPPDSAASDKGKYMCGEKCAHSEEDRGKLAALLASSIRLG